MCRRLFVLALFLLIATPLFPATTDDEVRATFDRFVVAQNAHDLKALENLLLDSPQFLWITRGTAVWGRAEALKRFEGLFAGTWHLEPDISAFRIVFVRNDTAEIFVPIDFSIGTQQTRFLMNQVLVKSESGWKVASILPIPLPPPASK